MTKNIIWAIGIGIVISSCGGNEASIHDQILAKKKELAAIQKEINELEKLDTTKAHLKDGVKVSVSEVVSREFDSFFEIHGVIETDKNVTVAPEVSGVVKSIKVKEGQLVNKGDVLVVLETDIIEKNLQEVEKSLELAIELYEKQKRLQDKNVGTEVDYLQAKNRKESLEQTISTLKAQLNKSYVKSPISGTLDEVLPKEGELTRAGSPIARVINIRDLYVNADVSEAYLGSINIGDEVEVKFPSINDEMVIGKIINVGKYINAMNRTFSVRVKLTDTKPYFLPNLLAVLKVKNTHLENAVVVPNKVILDDGKSHYVFTSIKKNGKEIAHKTIVEEGETYMGETVIRRGLNEGDLILIKGQTAVVEGEELSID